MMNATTNQGDKKMKLSINESIKQQQGRKSLVINAKYKGRCAACHQPFGKGAQIVWFQNPSQYFHTDCWSAKFGTQCTAIAQNPVTNYKPPRRRVRDTWRDEAIRIREQEETEADALAYYESDFEDGPRG